MLKKLTMAIGIAGLLTGISCADEGMWTFDNIPVKKIKAKYNFEPTQQWLDNVRLSSVRFNDGGSGAFISKTGLVITNHHVASGQLQKMSSAQKDYLKEGFYAPTQELEQKCTDLELNVLFDMKNVTEEVIKSAEGLDGEKAIKARKAKIAQIEKANKEKTGMRSDVVKLYNGGEYWLYTYKKYRDVRLVMAPEKQIAFYGGSYDNFTYPRYDLDFAIFRVYENDKPINCDHFLKFSTKSPEENSLIFVSGNPGRTKRNITYSQYLFSRDFQYPAKIYKYNKILKNLYAYAKQDPESARRAETLIFSYENSKKVSEGEFKGVKDKELSAIFKTKEDKFRESASKDPKQKAELDSAYNDIGKAVSKYKERYDELAFGCLGGNRLPEIAFVIVRYCTEMEKPDAERKNGFHDSQLDVLKYEYLSPEPIYDDLETVMLRSYLEMAEENLGSKEKNPIVKMLLDIYTPNERAKQLIAGTRLKDVEYRKKLMEGGLKACKQSKDPLIQLALQMEPIKAAQEDWYQKEYESRVVPSVEKIAAIKFKTYGKDIYPDATFTPRLAYGPVKRYETNGTYAPCKTTFYGLYDRYYSFKGTGMKEWDIPKIYLEKESKINKAETLDFVYDADTIGGNSGSPVVNTKGELVGINFDRNTEGMTRQFMYDGRYARSLAVSAVAVFETLRNVYGAEKLADELTKTGI